MAPTKIPVSPSLGGKKIQVPSTRTSRILEQAKKLENHDEVQKAGLEIRKKLLEEWNKGSARNFAALDEILEAAKIVLTKLKYMPSDRNSVPSEKDMLIAREILEIGAKTSVAKKTEEGLIDFERYMSQLKHYYFDLKDLMRHESESMHELLGMNLLKLLSQNQIAAFHVELELFVHQDVNKVLSNVFIRKAVEVEQFLTEGRYNKILDLHLAKEEDLKLAGLNSEGFKYFIDRVVEKSRAVIADVIESAFERLSPKVAHKQLHIQKPQELIDFARKRNWTLNEDDGYFYFAKEKRDADHLASFELVKDALNYAKDLSAII